MNSRERQGDGPFRTFAPVGFRSKPDLQAALGSLRKPVFRQLFLRQILSSSGSVPQGVTVSGLALTT